MTLRNGNEFLYTTLEFINKEKYLSIPLSIKSILDSYNLEFLQWLRIKKIKPFI